MAWTYILKGSNGRHYIGSTSNLDRRLKEHWRGETHSTRRLGNQLQVIASHQFPTIQEARKTELMLKAKKNPRLAIYYLSKM